MFTLPMEAAITPSWVYDGDIEDCVSIKFSNPDQITFHHHQTKGKIMIAYKKIGLVNTRTMLEKAAKGGYAIPAYNLKQLYMHKINMVLGSAGKA